MSPHPSVYTLRRLPVHRVIEIDAGAMRARPWLGVAPPVMESAPRPDPAARWLDLLRADDVSLDELFA
ncbi:MAG: hypothetical protein KDE64_01615 [Rhodocyclaceae bacterium]|nr:hypothetical protein [Rhodocyclaceae bacterium]